MRSAFDALSCTRWATDHGIPIARYMSTEPVSRRLEAACISRSVTLRGAEQWVSLKNRGRKMLGGGEGGGGGGCSLILMRVQNN